MESPSISRPEISGRVQHIWRCPGCYVKLTFPPSLNRPCSVCGYPQDPEVERIYKWVRHFKALRKRVEGKP